MHQRDRAGQARDRAPVPLVEAVQLVRQLVRPGREQGGFVVEDPKARGDVEAMREQHKVPDKGTSSVINSVLDKDNKDHPDMKANGGAVDAVIQAQGNGGGKK